MTKAVLSGAWHDGVCAKAVFPGVSDINHISGLPDVTPRNRPAHGRNRGLDGRLPFVAALGDQCS